MVTLQTLQKYSLFGGLTEEQIANILPLMELESYKPDTDIIVEGKSNDRIYFIIDGVVRVIKGGVVLCDLETGETFGEMEVLDVMPSVATVRTISEVGVMSFSHKSLRGIYGQDIKAFALIIMNLARCLSRRLRRMDEKQVDPN